MASAYGLSRRLEAAGDDGDGGAVRGPVIGDVCLVGMQPYAAVRGGASQPGVVALHAVVGRPGVQGVILEKAHPVIAHAAGILGDGMGVVVVEDAEVAGGRGGCPGSRGDRENVDDAPVLQAVELLLGEGDDHRFAHAHRGLEQLRPGDGGKLAGESALPSPAVHRAEHVEIGDPVPQARIHVPEVVDGGVGGTLAQQGVGSSRPHGAVNAVGRYLGGGAVRPAQVDLAAAVVRAVRRPRVAGRERPAVPRGGEGEGGRRGKQRRAEEQCGECAESTAPFPSRRLMTAWLASARVSFARLHLHRLPSFGAAVAVTLQGLLSANALEQTRFRIIHALQVLLPSRP